MLKLIHFQASVKHSAPIPAADKEASQRISIHLHNAIKSVDSFAFSVVMGFSMSPKYFWDGNFKSSPTWTINEDILMNTGASRVCVMPTNNVNVFCAHYTVCLCANKILIFFRSSSSSSHMNEDVYFAKKNEKIDSREGISSQSRWRFARELIEIVIWNA